MNKTIEILINDMAEAIIDIYQIKIPIDNIDDIIKSIGGKIIINTNLESFSNGKIKKNGNNSFIIELPFYQTTARKNLAVAYQLGHLFLHMGFNTNKEKWNSQDNVQYYFSNNNMFEYEANEFAKALLMPRKQYLKIMNQNTEKNIIHISPIADYFHVSIDIASRRGKTLNYIKSDW